MKTERLFKGCPLPLEAKKILDKKHWYQINGSMIYPFREESDMNDGGMQKQVVYITFDLEGSQYALLGHEYRPLHRTDFQCKAADINIFHIDEERKKYILWLLDIKVSLKTEDDIARLVEQLSESFRHVKFEMSEMEHFERCQRFGFFVANYDMDGIKKLINDLNKEIKERKKELDDLEFTPKIRNKIEIKVIEERKRSEFLKQFIEGKTTIDGMTINLENHEMKRNDEGILEGEMLVKM